ncbi:hypothetical protein GCM10025778_25200 [Paeniglutamicibacter antarcticus]|uniref:Uncharacterized protein n=1 Tax=Paeniglutamicibacter antarcticus TaxID=494023 RepID=A0ABP9TN33_9MICC
MAAQLCGVSAAGVQESLKDYARRQRPCVIAAHENSRQLAKIMLRTGRVPCMVRDIAMRFISLNMALGPILTLHRNPSLRTTTATEH